MRCEFIAERFLIDRSYHLLARSFKTPYGELDRLFLSPWGEYVILEVKSLGSWGAVPAVQSGQRQRLCRNLEYLSSQRGAPVELVYAVVSRDVITFYGERFESVF